MRDYSHKEKQERIEAYGFIINNESEEQIKLKPEFLEEFASLGYITFGMDALSVPRFKTTDFGRECAKEAYLELCSSLADEIE
jgi:hypothetical protein